MLETFVGAALAASMAAFGFVFHLGTRVSVIESQIHNFEKWLERVEDKLDQAINR